MIRPFSIRSAGTASLTALALLGVAGVAGAYPVPENPADGEVVATLKPTFEWSGATCIAGSPSIQIIVDGVGVVAEGSGGAGKDTSDVSLADDSVLRWYVRTLCILPPTDDTPEVLWRTIRVSTPVSAAPVITQAPPALAPAGGLTFAWTGTRAQAAWQVVRSADGVQVRTGVAGGTDEALVEGLPTGAYAFSVAQTSLAGTPGPAAQRAFAVDADVPGPLTLTAGPTQRARNPRPTFVWRGLEPGATVTWLVLGRSGAAVQGPATVRADRVAVGPLMTGDYVFQARQSDPAGNPSDWLVAPFSLNITVPVTSMRLPATNSKRMTPRAGTRVRTRRPLLRWARRPGARYYNIQIFQVRANGKLPKRVSAFPRGRVLRVPKGKLKVGRCYVWRVWPNLGRQYTKAPLGISNFCVIAPKKR